MKLDKEQHRRGILSWDTDGPVAFSTATTDSPTNPPKWSDDLTDHGGTVVESPSRSLNMLRCLPKDPATMSSPFEVRWERIGDNSVITQVWNDDISSAPTKLRHLPGYGIFHRLVIATPFLGWNEDISLRVGGAMLRLVTGELYGESVSPMDQVTIEDGNVAITGEMSGSTVVEGKFIEIVAPGSDPDEAEARAHSILGLAAVVFGPHANGEEVFSEPFKAEIGHQFGTFRIPVSALNPRTLSDVEIDTIHSALSVILEQNTRMSRALSLALVWYEKGTRSISLIDQFLGLFIGIETLINTYVKEHGPVLAAEERVTRFDKMINELRKRFSQNEFSRVKERLVGTSFGERVAHYAQKLGWDDSFTQEIRDLAKIRSSTVHGDLIGIIQSDVTKARDNLVRLIRATINVPDEFEWQTQAQILSLELQWEYRNSP